MSYNLHSLLNMHLLYIDMHIKLEQLIEDKIIEIRGPKSMVRRAFSPTVQRSKLFLKLLCPRTFCLVLIFFLSHIPPHVSSNWEQSVQNKFAISKIYSLNVVDFFKQCTFLTFFLDIYWGISRYLACPTGYFLNFPTCSIEQYQMLYW
jgi:hypothetical protein